MGGVGGASKDVRSVMSMLRKTGYSFKGAD